MVHGFIISDAIIAQAENWTAAQYAALSGELEQFPVKYEIHTLELPPTPLARSSERIGDHQSYVAIAFEALSTLIAQVLSTSSATDRAVGILDVRLYTNISELRSLGSVQGLLMLAFPEILWVPCFQTSAHLQNALGFEQQIGQAVKLSVGGFTPLFDGMGLRSCLFEHRRPSQLNCARKDVCLSIDEERNFALFNSYVAFRFGYRAYPIMTQRVADMILKQQRGNLPCTPGCSPTDDSTLIAFEDAFIEFADTIHEDNSCHVLGDAREENWPLLANADFRVLTTSAEPEEKIARLTSKVYTRASTYFVHTKGAVLNVLRGSRNWMRRQVSELGRMSFNMFAGGWIGASIVNCIEYTLILGVLALCLLCFPILFIPLLFAIFVLWSVIQAGFTRIVERLIGRESRLFLWARIYSQWRYMPKMYERHCPTKNIHRHLAHYWCLVGKPISGIFGLRNACCLPNGRRYEGLMSSQGIRSVYRHAIAGAAPTESGHEIANPSHAAYGMTLEVATFLIRRAEQMKNLVSDVEGAIHAAVLATCAYELLGHKTPAASIQALTLRHYFEVLAECEFPGIRAKFDMKDRYTDIHNSMFQICRTSLGKVKETLFASGMAEVCDSLAGLLREHGKYEEAAFFSRRSRYMHRLLLPTVMRNLLAFPEWCVRSKLNFAFSIMVTIVVFLLYVHICIDHSCGFSDLFKVAYLMLFSTSSDMTFKNNVDRIAIELTTTNKVVVQAIRQLMLIHVGFLATLFYDFMHRK